MTVSPNVFFTLSFSLLEIRPGCSSLGPNNDNFRMTVLWGARIVQDLNPMLVQGQCLMLVETLLVAYQVSRLSPPPPPTMSRMSLSRFSDLRLYGTPVDGTPL